MPIKRPLFRKIVRKPIVIYREGGGNVSGIAPTFDFFVDSVSGSDANSGLTALLPKQTLAAISTLLGSSANKRVAMKRGSVWRERLSLTANNNNTVFEAYGSGSLPEVRCDDVVPNANFSLTAGRTNVYQVTLTVEPDAIVSEWPGIWENGVRLSFSAVSLISNEGVPGTFYYGTIDDLSSITVYIHPYGDTNAITDGKLYEAAIRKSAIDTYLATNCAVRYIQARRPYTSFGCFPVGRNSILQCCEAYEGNTHNIHYRAGATIEDCLARNAYSPNVGPILYVGYEGPAPAVCSATVRRCIAEITVNPRLPIVDITGITNASTGVFTTAKPHGLANGDYIDTAGILGMTEANLSFLRVQNVTASTFTCQTTNSVGGTPALNTTGFGVYTSGGTVRLNAYSPETIGFYNHTDGATTWDSISYEYCNSNNNGIGISAADTDAINAVGGTISQFLTAIKPIGNANISNINAVNSPAISGAGFAVLANANSTYNIIENNITVNSSGATQVSAAGVTVNFIRNTLIGSNSSLQGNVANQTWNVNGNNFIPNTHGQVYNFGAGATGLSLTSNFNAFNGVADGFIIQGVTYPTFALYKAATGQDANSTN